VLHPTIFADKPWYLSKWSLLAAPQFDCLPQKPVLDPPLIASDTKLTYSDLEGNGFALHAFADHVGFQDRTEQEELLHFSGTELQLSLASCDCHFSR